MGTNDGDTISGFEDYVVTLMKHTFVLADTFDLGLGKWITNGAKAAELLAGG